VRKSLTNERNEFEKVENAVGQYNKSAYNKRILSKHKGQTGNQNNINTELYSIGNISWENKVILTPN